MKTKFAVLIGVGVCAFVLWPMFIAGPSTKMRLKRAKDKRAFAGCIPLKDGKVFLINGRKKHKFLLPKGGIEEGEMGYYAAGKEALEEAGVIGKIDMEPITREGGVDWYIMDVEKVLSTWKEQHERIRQEMALEDALLHSEVRAVVKVVLKSAARAEKGKPDPRIKMPDSII